MESLYLRSLLYASCSYLHYIAQIKACTISGVFQLSRFADSLSFSTSVDNFVAGKGSDASPPNIGVKPGISLRHGHPYTPSSQPTLPRYLNICGYPDRSNGMNI